MAKYQIIRRTNDEFQFNLVADNSEIILTSEGYSSRSGCEKGILSVRENSSREEAFERKMSVNGKHFFNLKAKNFQVIGTSQMYDSASSMEKGIRSVMKNGAEAADAE